MPPAMDLQQQLAGPERIGPERVGQVVNLVLVEAVKKSASDVHFEPTHRALEIRFRLDGVLHTVATLNREIAANIVARLKVLAELLTYRLDVPQEGRLVDAIKSFGVEMRVSTFPTIHGEKAAVRIFDPAPRTLDLDQLGLAPAVLAPLKEMLKQRSGAILLTGPSGSGKTTTIYACLRHLIGKGGRHIVTIEDPVEQVIEGASQSHARSGTEFDFARGLRSLLRQDPEVIMIGEVRDRETAGIAIEAALTGHLVFSTLHAGSACGVIGRLLAMGVETYLLTSGLRGILNQRLVRRLCPACRQAGCSQCAGTGYQGRMLLGELLTLEPPLREAILAHSDTATLEATASKLGEPTLRDMAEQAARDGLTSHEEIERVLGPKG
ncbi:MAG: type II/IV secretion system protein [Planctomycetes bacterium]|nr:type II/IV secretion system protein [Planctomycetota bacterium]